MKNLTIDRPGDVSLPGVHRLPRGLAALYAHLEAPTVHPTAHYSDPATGGVLEPALVRWPLLREIDQSLIEMQQKAVDPYAVREMSL